MPQIKMARCVTRPDTAIFGPPANSMSRTALDNSNAEGEWWKKTIVYTRPELPQSGSQRSDVRRHQILAGQRGGWISSQYHQRDLRGLRVAQQPFQSPFDSICKPVLLSTHPQSPVHQLQPFEGRIINESH